MAGLIFLTTLVLFIAVILCLWVVLARTHGSGWLIKWLPPFCFTYLYEHRNKNQVLFWSLCLTSLLFIATSVFWSISNLSETTPDPTDTPYLASIQDGKLSVSKEGNIISEEEWVFLDAALSKQALATPLNLVTPEAYYSFKDSATKTFNYKEMDVKALDINKVDDQLIISISLQDSKKVLYADFDRDDDASSLDKISPDDIKHAIDQIWKTAPEGINYRLGTIRPLSDNQSIVGIRIIKDGVLDKEVTLTVDQRLGKPVVNHRSVLSLRKTLVNYRTPPKTRPSNQNTLFFSEFIGLAPQYVGKQVTVYKLDKINVTGEFKEISNSRVIKVTKRLGSGVVEVNTPLTLIKELKFRDLLVTVASKPSENSAEENVVYLDDLPEGTDLQEGQQVTATQVNKLKQDAQDSLAEKKAMDDAKKQETPESVVSPESVVKKDPLTEKIGRFVIVTTNENQSRVGELVKVIPHKSISVRASNGGIEYHIPQEKIKSITYPKK